MRMTSIGGILIILAMLSGCGNKSNADKNPSQQTPVAVVKLITQGARSNSTIAAVQVTLRLPTGVSVKDTQNPPQTDSGVVMASGSAAGAELIMGTYLASSNTVTVYIPTSAGFAVGEFATVTCDLSSGLTTTVFNDSVSNLSVWDTSGAPISGLTASFTVSIN